MAQPQHEESSIKLNAIDAAGKPRVLRLRAVAIQKQGEGVSNAEEIDPFGGYLGTHKLIQPRYNLSSLINLKEQSTELGQCIRAMVTNTAGFGWQLKERTIPDEIRDVLAKEIQVEKLQLLSFLETIHPTESLNMLLEKSVDDQFGCGNGYLELIENPAGELVGLGHIQAQLVRLTEKYPAPVKVMVNRISPAAFTVEQVPMLARFRKYCILSPYGDKLLWFKEAGDPRLLDKTTGEFALEVPQEKRASSLIHLKTYSATTPYGVPEYIGNLFSIYGSRAAEEINYDTLYNNAIPSMFVIIENGVLTSDSINRLRQWTEEQVQKGVNRSKFILLEGEAMEEGVPTPSACKIRIEPLKKLQQEDELFQQYDGNNREKLRQCFRLPPIFLGQSADYNRATSDTAKRVADEQVFAPSRDKIDFLINRHVLARLGARFHVFKLNHPNITDDTELIRLMAIAERSGAMTPKRADRIVRDVFGDDIGPMPSGIDLNVPFSLTFAEAQKGGQAATPGMGGRDDASRVLDSLFDMRKRIADELDARFLQDEEDSYAD